MKVDNKHITASHPHNIFYFIKYSYFLSGAMRCCEIAIFMFTGYFLATHYSLASMLAFFIGSLVSSLALTFIVHNISEVEDNSVDTINLRMSRFLGEHYQKTKEKTKKSILEKAEDALNKKAKSQERTRLFFPYFYYLFIDFMCVFGAMWNIVDEINRWVLNSTLPSNLNWFTSHIHILLVVTLPIPLICLFFKFKYTRQMFVMRESYYELDRVFRNKQKSAEQLPDITQYKNKLYQKLKTNRNVENLLASSSPLFWDKKQNTDDIYIPGLNPEPIKPNETQHNHKLKIIIKLALTAFFSTIFTVLYWIWLPSTLSMVPFWGHIVISMSIFALSSFGISLLVDHYISNINEDSNKINKKTHDNIKILVADSQISKLFDKQNPTKEQKLAMKLAVSFFRYEHINKKNNRQLKSPQSFFEAFVSYLVIPIWNLVAIAFPIVFNINIFGQYLFSLPSIFSSWPSFLIEGTIAIGLAILFSLWRTEEHFTDKKHNTRFQICRDISAILVQAQNNNNPMIEKLSQWYHFQDPPVSPTMSDELIHHSIKAHVPGSQRGDTDTLSVNHQP